MNAADVFRQCFGELERRGIPHVVLHSYDRYPDCVLSDVDCCVADDRLGEALAGIHTAAARSGWLVTQILQYDICAYYMVLADPEQPERWLKLDICSHYSGLGRVFLRDAELLHERRPLRGFFVPVPSSECLYLLVKVFVKAKDPTPVIERLHTLGQREPERTQALFVRVFGSEAGRFESWLARPAAEWAALGRMAFARNGYTLFQRLQAAQRAVRRTLQPTGITLAFLGPDGVGKSTVIQRSRTLVSPHFRRELLVHFVPRPGARGAGGAVTNPHAQPPRSAGMSWAKILFYFGCVWAHWLARQVPARIRSTCVVFDRTFEDLWVDSRRYRVQGSDWLVRGLRPVLPGADITFVLDAPTEVIQGRKAEVPPEETERQRRRLRQLMQANPRWVLINTEMPPEASSRVIAQQVIQWLSARVARRTRPDDVQPRRNPTPA